MVILALLGIVVIGYWINTAINKMEEEQNNIELNVNINFEDE